MSQSIRHKAEALLRADYALEDLVKDKDLPKILHELRVHQIELELQNEELLRTQQELTATQKKYFDLYNFAPVGYFTLDQHGVIIDLNLVGAEMLGREKGRLINKPMLPHLSPEARPIFFHHLDVVFETQSRQSCELSLKNLAGSKTYFLAESVVAQTGDEHPLCRMVMTDITWRKQAEQALRKSEERFRVALLNSPVFVSEQDRNLRYIWIHSSQRSFSTGEIIGKTDAFLFSEADAQLLSDLKNQALESGQMIRQEVNVTINNKPRYYDLTIEPAYDVMNQVTGVLCAHVDITQIKEVEAALRASAEELKRSNAELEQFAYVASHDLQEPLRMIAGYVQLIERRYKGQLDSDADEFIYYAVDGAKRMQRLIHDLLALSRIGRKEQKLAQIDCNQLLEQVLINLQVAIEDNEATITRDILPTLNGDSTQLGQLLQNLIVNAIKFQSDSSPVIHISAKQQKTVWEFTVQDNGIGIPADQQDRIFMIFQRLHSRGEYPGTGIGLAICKKIVERHGGTIWVESQSGQGSTFHFTIPY
ncbi:MAG: PAS domain-containing protein [Anaerolineae bacterium]|nr:PAS domain-containing protein [Anaerolineae bacterium]